MKTFHWSTLVAFGLQLFGLAFGLGMLAVVMTATARGGESDTLPRAPCEVRPTALEPPPPTTTALPRGAGTGIPPLDDLLREAKRQGTPVVQQFNEDGVGLVWFKATPDGWLSRVPAPVIERPVDYSANRQAKLVQQNTPQSSGYLPQVDYFAGRPPQLVQSSPVREVRAPQAPFRGTDVPWVEGHRCPRCDYESPDGEGTWVIRGGNPSGVHQHQCPRCGQRWAHAR